MFEYLVIGLGTAGICHLLAKSDSSHSVLDEITREFLDELRNKKDVQPKTCPECGTQNPHYCGRDGAQWKEKGCRCCVVCASGDKWYCGCCKRGKCCIEKAYSSAEHSDCKDCDYDYDD